MKIYYMNIRLNTFLRSKNALEILRTLLFFNYKIQKKHVRDRGKNEDKSKPQ